MQSLKELEKLALTLSREEERKLPSQSESDFEGPYLIENFNILVIFFEQSIMTLENEMVIEQSCSTKRTNLDNLTKIETYKKELEW